jgi:hypothetical protein
MSLRNVSLFIIIIDQASKIFVKTNFILEKKLKFSGGLNSFFIENEEWLGGLVELMASCFDCFRLVAVGGTDIGYGIL